MQPLSTSTTTKSPGYKVLALRAVIALAAWFAVTALTQLFFEPSRTVIVIGPAAATWRAVAASDVKIVDVRFVAIKAFSMRSGFVRSLYANGAWLVFPSVPTGCIDIS